jgi:antitoxin Phd
VEEAFATAASRSRGGDQGGRQSLTQVCSRLHAHGRQNVSSCRRGASRGGARAIAGMYETCEELYDTHMVTMSVSAAREQLAEIVEQAGREAVVIERYGRAAAVMISPARYEELMDALEEVEDVAAFDEAMAEEGPNIPWEQVKADLGWQ